MSVSSVPTNTGFVGVFGNPNADMMTKLNRFQKALNGQAGTGSGRAFSENTLKLLRHLPNKMTNANGVNVAKLLGGPMADTQHTLDEALQKIAYGNYKNCQRELQK